MMLFSAVSRIGIISKQYQREHDLWFEKKKLVKDVITTVITVIGLLAADYI